MPPPPPPGAMLMQDRNGALGLAKIRVVKSDTPETIAAEEEVKAAKAGSATVVRETERGAEFIGICSAREVSDDRVAQMVFQAEGSGSSEDNNDTSKKLTEELRAKAQIIRR